MIQFTSQDALRYLRQIQEAAIKHDHEAAHLLEDEMREKFIHAVADDQCENIRDCAELVMRSSGLNFNRWCA